MTRPTAILARCLLLAWLGTAVSAGHAAVPAEVFASAEATVRAALGRGAESTDVAALPLDARLRLAPCTTPLDSTLHGALTANTRRATVRVRCTGDNPWKLYVPVRITRRVDVPVAKRDLPAGAILAATDLAVEQRALADLPSGTVTSVDAVIGRELRQAVPGGYPLGRYQLRDPIVVNRGQFVTIESSNASIVVKMGGISQSAGITGSVVTVRNQSSGQYIQARVIDGRRVQALGAAR